LPLGAAADTYSQSADTSDLSVQSVILTVEDFDRAVPFYRDKLGFTVAGKSVNMGPEQERLTGVFGARVRITGLRPPGGGIGVEFLEYQAPNTGRPLPPDTRANDLWHAHIRMQMSLLNPIIQRLLDGGSPSSRPASCPSRAPHSATTRRR
jgi:hypothetical protein